MLNFKIAADKGPTHCGTGQTPMVASTSGETGSPCATGKGPAHPGTGQTPMVASTSGDTGSPCATGKGPAHCGTGQTPMVASTSGDTGSPCATGKGPAHYGTGQTPVVANIRGPARPSLGRSGPMASLSFVPRPPGWTKACTGLRGEAGRVNPATIAASCTNSPLLDSPDARRTSSNPALPTPGREDDPVICQAWRAPVLDVGGDARSRQAWMGQSSSSMLQPPGGSSARASASDSGARDINPTPPHAESPGASGSGTRPGANSGRAGGSVGADASGSGAGNGSPTPPRNDAPEATGSGATEASGSRAREGHSANPGQRNTTGYSAGNQQNQQGRDLGANAFHASQGGRSQHQSPPTGEFNTTGGRGGRGHNQNPAQGPSGGRGGGGHRGGRTPINRGGGRGGFRERDISRGRTEGTQTASAHADAAPLPMGKWNATATDEGRGVVNALMHIIESMQEKPSVDLLNHFYTTAFRGLDVVIAQLMIDKFQDKCKTFEQYAPTAPPLTTLDGTALQRAALDAQTAEVTPVRNP